MGKRNGGRRNSGGFSLFLASGALTVVSAIIFIKPEKFYLSGGLGHYARQKMTYQFGPEVAKGFAVILLIIAVFILLVGIKIIRGRD